MLVGFGRCGSSFAFHDYGLEPDLITMSKAITGGYIPFGALWTSPAIARYYDDEVLACGLTSYGHPLGLAALDAVLDLLSDADFLGKKAELEALFGELVSSLDVLDEVSATRHRGLMARIDLKTEAPTWQPTFEAGLHLFSLDNMILLAPPYISDHDRLRSAFDTLRSLIGE